MTLKIIPKLTNSLTRFSKLKIKSRPYIADKPYVAYMSSLFFQEEDKSAQLKNLAKFAAKTYLKVNYGIDLDNKAAAS